MSKKTETPWIKYYDGVREHLDYPNYSAYDLIRESCEKYADLYAYNYFGKRVKYKKFIKQIDQAAKAFLSLGVKMGDIVCLVMPNTPEAIISFYALNKIGAIANMIHPLSGENEFKYYFNLTNCEYVLCIDVAFNKVNHILDETNVEKVILVEASRSMPEALKMGYTAYNIVMQKKVIIEPSYLTISWKKFYKSGKKYKGPCEVKGNGNSVGAILYSGGTTGKSKGIELTNHSINAVAISANEACAVLKPKDKVLAILPIFHGFGLGVCVHTTLYFGGTCILVPQFNVNTFDGLLKTYKPNVVVGVPTLYEALLKNPRMGKLDLSFLKCCISGGDSLSTSLKEKIDNFLHERGANIQIRQGYGLTECICGTCLTPQNEYRDGSIGIPYPDTIYRIVEPGTEKELPYGKMGEIIISGPTVMKGYYKEEEETKNVLKTDKYGRTWLHTGDLAIMDSDGFVYYKQRLKRMIITSGYCVYPGQIENVIDSHPDVLMSCVIGVPHPYKVEVAKAFIVLKQGVKQNEAIINSIKKLCVTNLAKFSVPYEFEFRDSLPKTLVGKVAYKKLEEEEAKKRNNNN